MPLRVGAPVRILWSVTSGFGDPSYYCLVAYLLVPSPPSRQTSIHIYQILLSNVCS